MIKVNKPELLCPVGGRLQLIAAVQNGADAVYLGGSEFNARMYADNFSQIENLEEAVDYCHLRNVKVYITLNTLVNDEELERALDYAKQLYKIGVDAVIVQDLGLAKRISKEIPNLKIHISTQATITSKEGIEFFNDNLSVDRVVLARELSLEEIKDIVSLSNKEIEVFIHGALCVCYSGQCKLSSQIGARSGNRGKCAQPCRLPYKIFEKDSDKQLKEDYYLSTKDICTIDILPRIIEAGVHSLKIEGRMKSPEYVASVTRIYRKYIDKVLNGESYIVDDDDKKELLQVFNRGGFSTGYLGSKDSDKLWCGLRPKHWGTYLGKVLEYNEKKRNLKIKLEQDIHIGDGIEVVNKSLDGGIISFIRNKKDRVEEASKGDIVVIGDIKGKIAQGEEVYKITSKKLNDKLKQYFDSKEVRKTDVDLKINMKIGKRVKVEVSAKVLGKSFNCEVEDGIECEKGINRHLTKDDVMKQFDKTGDIPFRVNNIDIDLEDNLITPISNLNHVRRKVFETLTFNVINSFKHSDVENTKLDKDKVALIKNRNVKTRLSCYVYDINLLEDIEALNMFDRVYLSLQDVVYQKEIILSKISKEKIFIYLPTVTTKRYKKFIEENMSVIKEINNLVITNLEHIKMFENLGMSIVADNSFNIFNSSSLKSISMCGIDTVNLSNELSLERIKNIKVEDSAKIEIDMYGNLGSMYSNFCVIGAAVSKKNGCNLCKNKRYLLKDRKDKVFPVLYNNIDCNMKILNSDKLFAKSAVQDLNGKVDYMRLYFYDESKEQIENVVKIFRNILNNENITDNNLISNDDVKFTNGHFFKEV